MCAGVSLYGLSACVAEYTYDFIMLMRVVDKIVLPFEKSLGKEKQLIEFE